MTTAHRDLSAPELWERSLERSRYRRALLPRARRTQNRRKGVSAVVAAATMAGPGTPLAFALTSGSPQAAVAAETPSKRAIEVREGGLPLVLGSQGPLVAEVQRALGIPADGIFGVQTDRAVREHQARAGIAADGIVGPVTWASLFERAQASAVGGTDVPPEVKQRLERELRAAGGRLDRQAQTPPDDLFGSDSGETGDPEADTPAADPGAQDAPGGGQAEPPAPSGGQNPVNTTCGSSSLASPVNGTLTSPYGPRWGRNHDGIDIAAPTGTAIRAAACGSVTVAGTQSGYGNIVCITHSSTLSTCYAHMSRFAVSQGAQVRQGQVIGYVGCTGSCTGPHLHFETRVNGEAQDPSGYLNGSKSPSGSRASAATAGAGAAGGRHGATTTAQGGATASGGGGDATARWTQTAAAPGGQSTLAAADATTAQATVGPATAEPVAAAPAPVEPAAAPVPVEPAAAPVPVEPAAAPVPVEPAPAPVEPVAPPVPVEPAPAPVPVEPAPAPEPVEPAPVEPAVAPAPVDPAVTAAEPVAAPPAPAEPVVAPAAEPTGAPSEAPVSGGVPAQ